MYSAIHLPPIEDGSILAHGLIKSKIEAFAEDGEVDKLYKELRACIDTADNFYCMVDDVSAELTVYHALGRIEKIPREIGNENTDIFSIMYRFLSKYDL